ncbi:MAG TPA: hypothetical protein VM820_03935 [Vicinamibacterales bacterium]|jgi:hypothetical protein|nr:hypothetical protein [Vicinamibacterales bacterium]
MLRHWGEMQTDRIETALVVIAIAVSIQALAVLAALVGAVIAWRRARQELDARYHALALRLDEVIAQARDAMMQAREASAAVGRATERASNVMGDAGDVVRNIAQAVGAPRTLLVAGAASVAGRLLERWRRRGYQRQR